jgi:outer membrane protein assembly factor BamB
MRKMSIFYLLTALLFQKCGTSEKLISNDVFLELDAVSQTISQQNERIIYSSWDTSVKIYDINQNKVIFQKPTNDLSYAAPVVKNEMMYFPVSNKKFVCININTGTTIWELEVDARIGRFDLVDDTLILASVKHYGILGINAITGKTLYTLRYDYGESKLPDLSPWPISWDDKNFYVSNWQGNQLSSFNKINGMPDWNFKDSSLNLAGKCIVAGDNLFLGVNEFYEAGHLFKLSGQNARILSKTDVSYEERMEPVIFENYLFFYSYDKRLNRFDLHHDSMEVIKKFDEKSDLSGSQMYLINDTICFSDASFNLNAYSIKENKFSLIKKTNKKVLAAFAYNSKRYFVL